MAWSGRFVPDGRLIASKQLERITDLQQIALYSAVLKNGLLDPSPSSPRLLRELPDQ